MEILTVTDEGLACGGVSFTWADIQGISIAGETACLVSRKYVSGGLKFEVGHCSFVDNHERRIHNINGYPVEYCLMNRITFEHQRRAEPPVSRSE
jgi:hypothetical protein